MHNLVIFYEFSAHFYPWLVAGVTQAIHTQGWIKYFWFWFWFTYNGVSCRYLKLNTISAWQYGRQSFNSQQSFIITVTALNTLVPVHTHKSLEKYIHRLGEYLYTGNIRKKNYYRFHICFDYVMWWCSDAVMHSNQFEK